MDVEEFLGTRPPGGPPGGGPAAITVLFLSLYGVLLGLELAVYYSGGFRVYVKYWNFYFAPLV